MSESTLSLSYTDLLEDVGSFLGYGSDYSSWDARKLREVDRYIQAGIRQFYYPPAASGIEVGYEWSFIKPTTTLDTVAGTETADLPDDLGRVIGSLLFDPSVYQSPVRVITEAQLLAMISRGSEIGIPQYAAVRSKSSDGTTGQRKEVVFWPTPDSSYTLMYRYEAFNGKIAEGNPYPLGGMRFSELITESCLSVAELRANDERGVHWDQFLMLLATGVAMDRKQGAQNYGRMGDDVDSAPTRCRSGDVTYKGETW